MMYISLIKKNFLLFSSAFVLSCAQVQMLEGGDIDQQAPIPVSIVPPNKSVHFDQQQIKITFNEFIKLNNPLQTISVIPNDITIRAELHNKTLILNWDEHLRENTTYSIFLNRTVKDITESNDSIMQIVFSTGEQIDSLSYTAFVVNAESGEPEKNVIVGLFEHPDSIKPIYLAQTNENGSATLNYLKDGNFYVRAFSDELKQAKIGKNDRIAFKDEAIRPDTNFIDSLPLQMFANKELPKITSFQYTPPSLFIAKANRYIYDTTQNVTININEEDVSTTELFIFQPDSVGILFYPHNNTAILLKVETNEWSDSTRLRIQSSYRNKTTKLTAKQTSFLPKQTLVLFTSDIIKNVDTTQIEITNLSDSTIVKDYKFKSQNNFIQFWLPYIENERTKIKIPSSAIKISEEWIVEDYEEIFTHKSIKEFGSLNLTVENTHSAIIIEMIQNNSVIQKKYASDSKDFVSFIFTELEPGEYTFRVIEDLNGNKQWDTGDFNIKKQPEKIHFFSTPITIRANWDVEAKIFIEN